MVESQQKNPALGHLSPLRILHVLEATLGGTRRYLENIIEISDALPCHFGLVYSTRRCDKQFWTLLEKCQARHWELFEVPMIRQIHPMCDLKAAWQVRQIIQQFLPDIVHCHSSKAGGIGRLAVRSLSPSRPRVVYTPNALAVHLGVHFGIIERLLAPLTDLFIAISESEKREIMEICKVVPERVAVVWPVIEPTYFTPQDKNEARRIIGIPANAPVVTGVGRLTYQKDPLVFVRIIKYLKKEFPDLKAIWAGDGELRFLVDQEIDRQGLKDSLWITGWQEDIRPFVSAADVVLVTSRYESFGYVTAEALAMSRPVVATRVTGTVDIIIENQVGLLFEPGEWLSGAMAVAKLLKSPHKARLMGLRGHDHVIHFFSRDRMCENLSKAYQIAIGQNLLSA